MEEKNNKNEEFQTRREFLKKTAKGALPILGISLFGSALLEACEKENNTSRSSTYDSRRCSCSSTCSGSCDDSCSGNCDGCTGGCDGTGCTYM